MTSFLAPAHPVEASSSFPHFAAALSKTGTPPCRESGLIYERRGFYGVGFIEFWEVRETD